MNQKKQKSGKAPTTKPNPTVKKGKEDQTIKTSLDIPKRKKNNDFDDSDSNSFPSHNLRGSRKVKDKNTLKNDNSGMEDENPKSGKLIDYDEFKEFTDFLESLKHGSKKTPSKKISMEIEKPEEDWEVFRRESKKLTLLAFGLFDKIGLRFDPVKPKIGTTTLAPEIEQESKNEDKIEEEVPIIPFVPERNSPKMEIEEQKEEAPRKRLIDLLKIDLNPDEDDDDKNDDRLRNINFEPTLEMMRTSTHIDVESVSTLIDSKKKDTTTEIANKVIMDNLSENYQKIHELVSGISEADFQRLEPEVYLNDTLVNFYLKFIELGLINSERRNKVHLLNTYFMAKMRTLFNEIASDFTKFNRVYEKMERWTKKIGLLEKEFILMPINENEHWNLVLLCYPSRFFSNDSSLPLVVYLDSICRMEDTYARMLYHFFALEAKAKKKDESIIQSKLARIQDSGYPYYQPMVPKQSNWTDCGLYLLQYAELFSENEGFILDDQEELNKTRWFPRKLIGDKRDDMKRLINELKSFKYDAINDYLEKRNKRMKDYAKQKDQFDNFDQRAFEKALSNKYDPDILTPEEIKVLKLDFYYLGSLEYDQQDDMHF